MPKPPGSSRYYIGKSRIHGLGTMAARRFRPGDPIGIMTILRVDPFSHMPRLIRTELGRFINHSSQPNSRIEPFLNGSWVLVATEDIDKDDEITCSYCEVYDTYREAYGSFVIPKGYVKFREDLPDPDPPGIHLPECPHWSTMTEKH